MVLQSTGPEIGLIAQDVQKVLPWAVHATEPNEHLVVDYSKLVPILVDSVAKLQRQVDTLSQRVAELNGILAELKK